MGEFATAVQKRLCDALVAAHPDLDWSVEQYIAGTPVDVAGRDDERSVLVELEWRRADPADNTAKLFRHLVDGTFGDDERVLVCQVFTGYYDLASGGVSSKRENAEFVGHVADGRFERFRYHPVNFDLVPPKRGAPRPDGWRTTADEVAADIGSLL